MPPAAVPRPAATVVLVRAGGPFEVMLLRRTASMSFVPGAHVFPGGAVDESDRLAAPRSCCDGLDAPARFPHLDVEAERAYAVAVARELVEEAGVLLARRGGSWATTGDADAMRAQLARNDAFEQALREGGWRLALDALVPFARIVTPSSEPRRFDAHFFLAELPSGSEPSHAPAESDELVWATPAEALERGLRGEIVLLPPTWATLMLLEAFDSPKALLEWGKARMIPRIEPVLTRTADGPLLSMPGAAGTLRFSHEEGRGWRPVP